MATQLQKYNGRNIYNNAVTIDFKKQKVEFNPIKVRERTIRKIKETYLTTHLIMGLIILIYSSVIIIFIGNTIIEESGTTYIYAQAILSYIIITHILATIIATITTTYKSFKTMKETFPKRNKDLLLIHEKIVTLGLTKSKLKKKVINPEAIVNNQWIIPEFDNICLEYQATKEFAKNLKGIKIINHYQDKDYPWLAVFQFTKKPKNGKLSIQYI